MNVNILNLRMIVEEIESLCNGDVTTKLEGYEPIAHSIGFLDMIYNYNQCKMDYLYEEVSIHVG